MKYKVTLSIGFPSANKTAIIDVDEEDFAMLKTEEEKRDYLNERWQIWANDYIDGEIIPIE